MYVDARLDQLNTQYSSAELQFFLIVSVTLILVLLGIGANYLVRRQINNPNVEFTESRSKKLNLENRVLQGYIALTFIMTLASCYFLVNYGAITHKVISYVAQHQY